MHRKQREDTLRKLKAQDTKDRLFNTAFSLLSQKSFDEISIREITRLADVSIGTFYTYFKSKQDVFYQTYSLGDRYFENTVKPHLTQTTQTQQVQYFFDQYACYNVLSGLNLSRILYNPNNQYFNRREDTGMFPILLSIIQRGQDLKEFTSEMAADYIANYMMISARGLVYNWVTADGSFDLCSYMAKYCKLWIKPFIIVPGL